jgi:hypothetical protein
VYRPAFLVRAQGRYVGEMAWLTAGKRVRATIENAVDGTAPANAK